MKIEWKTGKEQLDDCFFVRKKVFVIEQGFQEELEFDEIDKSAWHICIYDKNESIATARLFMENNRFHCGRICVLNEYRKMGIGDILMKELEQKALSLGSKQLELSAQISASGFYEKHGFYKAGAEYLDEWCPHIRMIKSL